MEKQTQIGIGAAAGITLMAVLEPHLYEFHPILTGGIYFVLAVILIWGFSPIVISVASWLYRGGRKMWPQYLMLVCGIGFFVGLVAFLQTNVEPSKAEVPKEKEAKAEAHKPVTLLTMFATDFKNKFTGVSTGWSKDLETSDGYKTTINYDLHYDVGANAKFISVYIKEGSHLKDIAKYISDNAKSLFDDDQATLP